MWGRKPEKGAGIAKAQIPPRFLMDGVITAGSNVDVIEDRITKERYYITDESEIYSKKVEAEILEILEDLQNAFPEELVGVSCFLIGALKVGGLTSDDEEVGVMVRTSSTNKLQDRKVREFLQAKFNERFKAHKVVVYTPDTSQAHKTFPNLPTQPEKK